MTNKITIAVLTLLVVIGVGSYILYAASSAPSTNEKPSIAKAVVDEFIQKARGEVITKVGQPIEGFEPFMFRTAFPGLQASDFANVDAMIGLYRVEDGEIIYDLNGEPELHSAARAITDEGMEQLLANILARVSVSAESPNLVDDVLALIGGAPPSGNPVAGGSELSLFGTIVTFKGTIVCLPHKGDGPSTMECAYGLKADNGSHYGLKNLWMANPDLTDTNVRVTVTGLLAEPSATEKYDVVGNIDVQTANKI